MPTPPGWNSNKRISPDAKETEVRFASDSPLVETGFEPSVPLRECRRSEPLARNETSSVGNGVPLRRDRWFESGSLQRRVSLTGVFGGSRRKSPAFAGSVSLDVTRERDVLAQESARLGPFL